MKLSKDYVEARRNRNTPPLSAASEELKKLVENAIDCGEQFFIDNGYILLPSEFKAKVFEIPSYEYSEIVKWWEEYKWRIVPAMLFDSSLDNDRFGLIARTF